MGSRRMRTILSGSTLRWKQGGVQRTKSLR